jgi:pyruvate dehydrogenase E2 component (dihydrolipoamide acetyltransferase)
MSRVTVPDIGDLTDVPVIEILVAVGDEVEAEQGLVTLESDKATMEVPAPHPGVVEELLVAEGDTVAEGDPVAVISGEDGSEDRSSGEDRSVGEEDSTVEAGTGDGSGTNESGTGGSSDAGSLEDGAGTPSGDEPGAGGSRESAGSAPVYAGPSVRRIARKRGIDLSRVSGTGRNGRITVEDVEEFEPGRSGEQGSAATGIEGLDLAPWPEQISGPNLARNWVHIPHVTHHDEADITDLETFRKQINSEQDIKVTMVALLLKACVPVLKQYPEFNSSLDRDGLVLKRYYHLGFAADTPDGLLVPVIRDVDSKGLLEVAEELIELSGKARAGKLGPSEMAGATFTISSLGGIGGTGFTPIVNAPQVAILGATRSAVKPVWDAETEQFVPRLMLPLSLSYDHRVVDGAAAARFCVSLVKVLEDFRRIVL